LSGQQVAIEKVYGGATTLNLAPLVSGTYVYEIKDTEKTIKVGKVVKID